MFSLIHIMRRIHILEEKQKNSKEQYEQETGVNTWREIIRIDSLY